MNKSLFIGRVVKNPDFKMTESIDIAKFTLAVDRHSKDKTADFVNITAFSNLADICEKYLKKGQLVYVEAYVKTGSYEKDNKKIYTTDFIASDVRILIWNSGKDKGEEQNEKK